MFNLLNLCYLTYSFALGITPINEDLLVSNSSYFSYSSNKLIYIDLAFKLYCSKYIYVGGGVKTTILPKQITNYIPIQDAYDYCMGVNIYKNEYLLLNFDYYHQCRHIVACCKKTIPLHYDFNKFEYTSSIMVRKTKCENYISGTLKAGICSYAQQIRVPFRSRGYMTHNNLLLASVLNSKLQWWYSEVEYKGIFGEEQLLKVETGYTKSSETITLKIGTSWERKYVNYLMDPYSIERCKKELNICNVFIKVSH